MTDVYLRYLEEADGLKVGEIPFSSEAFEQAVQLVKSWGIYVDDFDSVPFHSAQLRLTMAGAYFEIIVGEE